MKEIKITERGEKEGKKRKGNKRVLTNSDRWQISRQPTGFPRNTMHLCRRWLRTGVGASGKRGGGRGRGERGLLKRGGERGEGGGGE